MKYLLVMVVVLLALWLWRARSQPGKSAPPAGAKKTPSDEPQVMVRCAVCGVHLPHPQALSDERGALYCGPEHRRIGASKP